MAESLSAACTPLKQKYDACFNAWFESYLESATLLSNSVSKQEREAKAKAKAEEYETRCGAVWREYRNCVQVSFISLFGNIFFAHGRIGCGEQARANGVAGAGEGGKSAQGAAEAV